MDDLTTNEIASALAEAELDTLKEINREAESFLAAQLSAGLAADYRAMTFAGVTAAISSFLIGGVASLVAAKIELGLYLAPVGLMIVCLVAALTFAVTAGKPTNFGYCGNDPRCWVNDIQQKRSLASSLAGQAALYAKDIANNSAVLDANHRYMNIALRCALGGVLGSAALTCTIVIRQVYFGLSPPRGWRSGLVTSENKYLIRDFVVHPSSCRVGRFAHLSPNQRRFIFGLDGFQFFWRQRRMVWPRN